MNIKGVTRLKSKVEPVIVQKFDDKSTQVYITILIMIYPPKAGLLERAICTLSKPKPVRWAVETSNKMCPISKMADRLRVVGNTILFLPLLFIENIPCSKLKSSLFARMLHIWLNIYPFASVFHRLVHVKAGDVDWNEVHQDHIKHGKQECSFTLEHRAANDVVWIWRF